MSISQESQKLQQDAIVTLFELDATAFGDGVLRFCPEAIDGGPAHFNGYQYQPIGIDAEGFEWKGEGTLPRPSLRVTAMQLAFLSLVLSADDLVGAPVRRIKTYRKHLDDGNDPDPLETFPIDSYFIQRKSAQTKASIVFELSVEMDQKGRLIPARQILRDACTHRYRWFDGAQYRYEEATCPYAGDGEWQRSGQPAEFGKDVCGKRLSDCRIRFGQNGVLPTRAYPGVGRA